MAPTPETPSQNETVAEALPEASVSTKPGNRESFLGSVLLGGLILIVILSLAAIAYGAFRLWERNQAVETAPSIQTLQDIEITEPEIEAEPESSASGAEGDALSRAKAADIQVLNGGAAAGTAGKVGEALETAGYTKITVDSAQGNFSGETIYYASGYQEEAEALKDTLSKDYPKVEVKAQEASNQETTGASLVLILGA